MNCNHLQCGDTQTELECYHSFLDTVKQNGANIYTVPIKLRTYKLCLEAVKQYGMALPYVPEEIKTAEMCLVAVKQDGNALEYIPNKLKTYELCLIAVKQNGLALLCVPMELRTYNLCLVAVKQNGNALDYVPKNSIFGGMPTTNELVGINSISEVLEFEQSQENVRKLCLEAVQQNGRALQYVPKKLRTYELCLSAVKQDGNALEFVPIELKSLSSHGRALDVRKILEICLSAVRQNRNALMFVPPYSEFSIQPETKCQHFITLKLRVVSKLLIVKQHVEPITHCISNYLCETFSEHCEKNYLF